MTMKKNIEFNKIYNESCLTTLSNMKDNSIDVVITSPPYNMNLRIRKGEYCSRQIVKEISTKYEGFADNLPIEEYNKFHSDVLKELLRVSNLVFYNVQIVTGSKRSIFKMIPAEYPHFVRIITGIGVRMFTGMLSGRSPECCPTNTGISNLIFQSQLL